MHQAWLIQSTWRLDQAMCLLSQSWGGGARSPGRFMLFCGIFAAISLTQMETPTNAAFVINISFNGDAQFQSAFVSAKNFWESRFSGYLNGIVAIPNQSGISVGQSIPSLTISVSVQPDDGPGGRQGGARLNEFVVDQAGFRIATDGEMTFDSADVPNRLADGTFANIVLHEMAHIMGFGTLWALNNVYTNASGEFRGASATSVWQTEFRQTGTPDVELAGGVGTADSHWNEVDFGADLTGIRDSQNRDMRDELMTGWLNPNPFVSELTIASFVDIGYLRVTTVPEPKSLILLSFGGIAACRFRRKANST